MTTNLPANLDELSSHDLAKLTGQQEERTGNTLPTLRVNYDDEDADGNTIPRGQWSCYMADGRRIFAKEVQIRIFMTKYQYNHYNIDKGEHVSTSIYFDKFGDECPDTAGGFKCNKVPRKKLDELTEAEQKVQKDIKTSRVCFGLLTAEGINPRGEPVSVENEPVMFYAKGTHFMPISGYINKTAASEGWLAGVVTKLGLTKKKNGAATYWEAVPETVGTVKCGKEEFVILRQFYDTVEAENKVVYDKWEAAQKNKPLENGEEVQMDIPFDDDIPANMRPALEAG